VNGGWERWLTAEFGRYGRSDAAERERGKRKCVCTRLAAKEDETEQKPRIEES
jgi:hypothetical protein